MGLNWSAIGVGATVIIAAFTAQQCTNEQISSLRKEVKQDVSSLRKEDREDAALLRKDIGGNVSLLRTEVRAGISQLRGEIRDGISLLRKEVREDAALLRKELRGEIASLRTDIARVGGGGKLGWVITPSGTTSVFLKELFGEKFKDVPIQIEVQPVKTPKKTP